MLSVELVGFDIPFSEMDSAFSKIVALTAFHDTFLEETLVRAGLVIEILQTNLVLRGQLKSHIEKGS